MSPAATAAARSRAASRRSRALVRGAVIAATVLVLALLAIGATLVEREREAALRLAASDARFLAQQIATDTAALALLRDRAAVDANRAVYLSGRVRGRASSVQVTIDTDAALLPGVRAIAVYGARGQRLAATALYPPERRDWEQDLLVRHRDAWREMVLMPSAVVGAPDVLAISRARWDDGRGFEGFSVALVDIGRLRDWVADQPLARVGDIGLYLPDGRLAAALAGTPRRGPTEVQALLDAASSEGSPLPDRMTTGVSLARDFPLLGVVEVPPEVALGPWRTLLSYAAFAGVALVLVTALFLTAYVRLERTRTAAEKTLRLSEQRLAAALENGNLSLWDWQADGDGVVFGDRLFRMLGRSAAEAPATVAEYAALMHPDDRDAGWQAFRDHVETPGPAFSSVHRLRRADGTWQWIASRGVAVERDEAGRARRIIGVHMDIQGLKAVENELREKSLALEESNRDLEQFAYIASHDLQEPLRMVSSYLTLLLRREGDRLSPQGREYADTAVDGAKRMTQLIRDLLEYSRIGTRGAPLEPLDMADAVIEAVGNLSIAIEDAGAEVSVQPGVPPIIGDRGQIVRLVQNLVGNALKYRAPDRRPEIAVGWREDSPHGMVILTIADNGIGIAPEFHERIFQIFQRLHGRDEYEGTGIGLAVCRRIVERHGGHMRVDSDAGRGATFFVALPRSAVHPGETDSQAAE